MRMSQAQALFWLEFEVLGLRLRLRESFGVIAAAKECKEPGEIARLGTFVKEHGRLDACGS